MRNGNKSDSKEPVGFNHSSCGTSRIRPSLLKHSLFYKLVFPWLSFWREKLCFSHTFVGSSSYELSSRICLLPTTRTGSWILVASNTLTTWLSKLMFLIFSHISDLESLRARLSFFLKLCKLNLDNLNGNFREVAPTVHLFTHSLCAYCCLGPSEGSPDTHNANHDSLLSTLTLSEGTSSLVSRNLLVSSI